MDKEILLTELNLDEVCESLQGFKGKLVSSHTGILYTANRTIAEIFPINGPSDPKKIIGITITFEDGSYLNIYIGAKITKSENDLYVAQTSPYNKDERINDASFILKTINDKNTENITNKEEGIQEEWYREAEKQTLETLPSFCNNLIEKHHEYGSVCHVMTAAAIAAISALDKTKYGAMSGAQAERIGPEFLRRWNGIKGPSRVISFRDLLYPCHEAQFRSIPETTWKWLQEEAKKQIENCNTPISMDVVKHWYNIVNGVVPFGLKIVDDNGNEINPTEIPFENDSGDALMKAQLEKEIDILNTNTTYGVTGESESIYEKPSNPGFFQMNKSRFAPHFKK